ncbi:Replication protein A 32 kDa subunit [Frankliniella fusca]|uniref:Replication protein A 32 kDa subunit n=1 Tax=Frankliniella fusca TaxID=407009 RepID=A0AAE1L6N5_9NEOP|nr:Replication protein A 32 kDa subunit [Frankliniella fusca]
MFDNNEGGYFNADNSFGGGSPQVPKKGDQKRAQNIMPVTARQVLSCPDDGLKIGSLDVYLVTLVGIVRAVETTSVKITYTLEDNTGCVDGVHWIDGQDESGQASHPQVVENTYCRLSGTIRTQGDKRYIMAFNIQQIEDFNEITTHFLEVALFFKKAEALSGMGGGGVMDSDMNNTVNGNGMSNNLSNSLMTSSVGQSAIISGLTSIQSRALEAIKNYNVENGLHSEELVDQLRGVASRDEVIKAVEFLCGEGHVYTTIDDFHFRSTDGM